VSVKGGSGDAAGFFPLAVGVLGFLAGAACLTAAGGGSRRVASGPWGAVGIALEVTDSGGKLDYDCAHGTISEPLVLDSEGRFDVKGLHFPERPGPAREGESSRGQPVRYIGRVMGDTMALTVKPEGAKTPIGDYSLVHGKTGRLRKCL
jgi:hypothetical protein